MEGNVGRYFFQQHQFLIDKLFKNLNAYECELIILGFFLYVTIRVGRGRYFWGDRFNEQIWILMKYFWALKPIYLQFRKWYILLMLVHLQYSAPHKKGQITVLWIIEIFCILYEPYFELINLKEIKHIFNHLEFKH